MLMEEKLKKLQEPLSKDDIEMRVGSCGQNGASILLYKTARVDTKRLNDVFGLKWKREHRIEQGRYVCRVSIFDTEIKEWISREDVGTESNTEKEKGAFSDAFKRACYAFGLGIELYDPPFIFIKNITVEDTARSASNNKKYKLKNQFYAKDLTVSKYEYSREDGMFIEITHKNDGVVYNNYKNKTNNKPIEKQTPAPIQETKPVVKQEVKTEAKKLSFKDFKTKIDNAESEAILNKICVREGGMILNKEKNQIIGFSNVEFDEGCINSQFNTLIDAIKIAKNELIKE